MATARANSLDWIGRLDSAVSEVFEMMLERSCVPMQDSGHRPRSHLGADLLFRSYCGECLYLQAERWLMLRQGSCLVRIPESDSSMVEDAVGELCNMIAGGWKRS